MTDSFSLSMTQIHIIICSSEMSLNELKKKRSTSMKGVQKGEKLYS